MAGAPSQNLTGTWHGQYSYQGVQQGFGFVAAVLDIGGALGGEASDAGGDGEDPGGRPRADISGRRSGAHVAFTKTYDGAHGWTHKVEYDGVLSEDCNEIEGAWRIAPAMSGRFLMIRPETKAQEVETRVVERV